MVTKKQKKQMKAFGMGLIVLGSIGVYVTHIGILASGLPQDQLGGHALINLVAISMVLLGMWLRR